MNSDLRKKKIQEIIKTQNPCGPNTTEKDVNDRGFVIAYQIPLSCLVFDVNNTRVKSLIQEFEKLHERKENPLTIIGRKTYSEILWQHDPSGKNNKMLEDIENQGQLRPGIISNDGTVIDGNRRFMALLKLAEKNKGQSFYFTAFITETEDISSLGFLPEPSQDIPLSIESNALDAFSKNQKNFLESFTNIKFSLMCDLFSIEKTKSNRKNKTFRFGDFTFDPKVEKNDTWIVDERNSSSRKSYLLDKYIHPTLYEFQNLDKIQINKFDASLSKLNKVDQLTGCTSIPIDEIKLDGVFIDLTLISGMYFQRDPKAKDDPLSSINFLNNNNGIVAIKADESFMAKTLKRNDEEYVNSPWEDYLNERGYYLQAVIQPNPFRSRPFQRSSVHIFTKSKENNGILVSSISPYFSLKWQKILEALSRKIIGKKQKSTSEFIISREQFYSYSNLIALREIDSFKSPYEEYKKVNLEEVSLSISKIHRDEYIQKVLYRRRPGVDYRQALGQEIRSKNNDLPINNEENIENSLIISPGRYLQSPRHIENRLPGLNHMQAFSIEFDNTVVIPFSEALKNITRGSDSRFIAAQPTSFEIVLKKSIKSEYFAIFVKSTLGQLVASSAHRWALVGNKLNNRAPRFSIKSLSQMNVLVPSLKIQEQVIDAHRKIKELESEVQKFDETLSSDPSLIISSTIENINEMLNLVGKLTVEERVKLMIKKVESDTNEFKQTWRLPMELIEGQNPKEEQKKITFGVIKVISSYLNSKGGELLIGYSEKSSTIEGLEAEFEHFWPKKNIDKQKDLFLHKFSEVLNEALDDYFYSQGFINFQLTKTDTDDRIVLFIDCKQADKPCYIRGNKAKNTLGNTFYRRIGDSSEPLEGEELFNYIRERWPDL